jgi:hypothetical protein
MIRWEILRPGILALVAELTGLQSVWQDKRRPYVDPKWQAVALCRVAGVEARGTDDSVMVDLGLPIPQLTAVEQLRGIRHVRLSVRVESFRHDDDRFAFQAAEALRSRLRWASSLAFLHTLGAALVTVAATVDLTGILTDDRVTSVAILETVFAVASCAQDDRHPTTWIESVVPQPIDHPDTEIL